jgi:hypothetical protein
MALTANLYGDWVNLVRDDLASQGYPPSGKESDEEIIVRVINLERRSIASLPREVHCAQGFTVPANLQAGFDLVKGKIEHGEDLRPHLSTRITDPDYEDAMLNEWGIHHLHLGTVIESKGFVNRTGPVLYARFESQKAFCLTVMPHGQWTNQQLIQLLV